MEFFMETIGKQHEKYKLIKNAIKTNNHNGYTVTDDIEIINLALNHNLEIELALYTPDNIFSNLANSVINNLKAKAKEIYEISSNTYDSLKLKDNHAGIIAMIKFNKYTLNDLKDKEFIIVLDHLEIPGNIGTIYRTLDSVKCDAVIIVDPISKVENNNVTSSSRGCNLLIPTVTETYENTLNYLINNNYDIYLGEPILGKSYKEYDYKNKIAIVVGNERFGINKDWYNHKSKNVFIPMEGTQNSLNVAVALSVLAYEAYTKRKEK